MPTTTNRHLARPGGEHVILVAVTVQALTRTDAHEHLHTVLPVPGEDVVDWWIAEDDRRDGSDLDSAVFVPMGQQQRWRFAAEVTR